MPRPKPATILLSALGVAFVAFLIGLVASSLRRPELEAFVPSPIAPEPVGERAAGPVTYTVDATANDDWTYFDFSRGSAVEIFAPSSLEWDIAFQRHRMITNGGATNRLGQAGVLDMGPLPLDSALTIPLEGFILDERPGDVSRNRALEDWYDYNWTSHVLRGAEVTFAIRTADGKYAVLRFIGYYCPGGLPGCVTFRYRYRGDGSRTFPPR